jgi:AcrR family transcriptional regulator
MEKKLPKGELTRKLILDTARRIFNERGVNITLDNLAKELGIPKGRITNHFATKDKLFLAILEDYEQGLAGLRVKLKDLYECRKLSDIVTIISEVMDLQFEYRCAILFLAVLSPGQEEFRVKTGESRSLSDKVIRHRMGNMVKHGLVAERVLEESQFELFMFIYVNTLSQWVIYYDMYDFDRDFRKMKPIYIKSIVEHVYGPYLTSKGRKQWKEMDLDALINSRQDT